jgi:hypothetical protein
MAKSKSNNGIKINDNTKKSNQTTIIIPQVTRGIRRAGTGPLANTPLCPYNRK